MVDIKEAYTSSSGHDLGEDIQKKHKGNRRKILLGLIKGKNEYYNEITAKIKDLSLRSELTDGKLCYYKFT